MTHSQPVPEATPSAESGHFQHVRRGKESASFGTAPIPSSGLFGPVEPESKLPLIGGKKRLLQRSGPKSLKAQFSALPQSSMAPTRICPAGKSFHSGAVGSHSWIQADGY